MRGLKVRVLSLCTFAKKLGRLLGRGHRNDASRGTGNGMNGRVVHEDGPGKGISSEDG